MYTTGEEGPATPTCEEGRDITVLHLDDDEEFLALSAAQLERESPRVRVLSTTDPAEAEAHLDAGEVDCVVSDYQMPEVDGLTFLETVREQHPELPFLLFTGRGSEEIAGRAISAGVSDYLQKGTGTDQFTVLANRVENTVEARRAERRARESDRRIREVHERITDAVVAVDEEWRYTYVNPRAEELLYRDAESLFGERLWDEFPAVADSEFEPAFREAMASQETVTVEAYFEPTEAWYEAHVYPDENGVSIYFRDVTERRERERDLREERAFTEGVLEALPDVLYAFDAEGNFLRWNDRLETVTGYDAEEIESMTPLDFIPEDEQAKISESIAAVFENDGDVTVESYFETKEGERIPYEFTGALLTDAEGEPVGLVGVGRDLSERRERERRFEAIFDNTYQFTGLADPDGTLLEANETALEFGGLDREDVVGKPMWEAPWFADIPETRERAREALGEAAEGTFVREELPVQGADDRAIIDFSARPLYDADGEVDLLILEGRNISELKSRERQLERQNERLEEFAGVLSHDLRNRLGVAEGYLTLANEDPDPEYLDQALTALGRMGDLVDDVLALAREGQVVDDPQAVSLDQVLSRAVGNVPTEGADVTVECPEGQEVLADAERLSVLVENLVGNAVAHAGDEPTVQVTLDGDRLLVEDDGPGIPADQRESAFEAGHTTSTEGTGFGLAIVERIAEAHGWSVEVDESPLGGARFVVSGLERP